MEYAFRSTLTRFLLVFTVLALVAGTVWAQGGSGELTGLVTDPQGAVVSGAEVKLTNPRTGEKVKVPARLVVKFKPGREMEERVGQLQALPNGRE